jgi:ubiquinone biosynthesis protein
MWKTADPVVREWMARHLGPVGKLEDAVEGASELGRFVAQVPALLSRAGTLMDQLDAITRDGLVLAPESIAAIGAVEARRDRWKTAALWTIAAGLAWLIYLVI